MLLGIFRLPAVGGVHDRFDGAVVRFLGALSSSSASLSSAVVFLLDLVLGLFPVRASS